MKKFLVSLLAVCGFLGADAQTMLKVRLADNSPINVSVDGRYFNKRGTSVTVGDLPPGRHWLQIFTVSTDRRGRARENIIYEGKVKTHEGVVSILTYDAMAGGVQVDEQDINQYLNEHPIPPPDQQQEQNEMNQQQMDNSAGNVNDNNAVSDNNNAPGASPAPSGTLSDAKVADLKSKVANKKTDTEIMKILKDGLGGETFTTVQIGDMMGWFSFESSKVDFAEWAYPNTVDKEYFSDLEYKLTYKNYRDDLDKFIKSR